MKRMIALTAVALFMGAVPALAADDSAPPTSSSVSQDAAKQAKQPDQGQADTSSGAMEQSSAPPSSGAATDPSQASSEAKNPPSGAADTSSGAMGQSSAPPSSAAANPNMPSPTGNSDKDQSSSD